MPAKLFILAFLAAAVVTASGGGLPASLLTLERAFPANQRVELEVLRARDRARHARILQGVVGGVVDFSVLGTSDPFLVGLYYTKVKLGSPPKEFKVQIDTGSDILWVTCSSCNDCPQSSELGIGLNFFDAPSSTTASLVSCSDPICASMVQTSAAECSAQSNQCGYSFQYGDGSGTSGFYVSDLLYFDTIMGASFVVNSSASVIFGCSTYQSGDLTKTDRAIDGIIGFGQQGLSVISQLSSRGVTPKVFSHCLKGEGNGGGILVVGEILNPNIVYSPLVPSQPHYNLYLQSIAVNGQLLPIDPAVFATSDNRGTIVDSGTTLTYLVEEAYDPFVSAITAAVSQSATPVTSKGHQCYVVPTSITEIFPPVALNFAGGASMVLRPEDYLLHYGIFDSAALWCIGFQKVQYQGITILGDLVLKDKIVVYDLAHQRLGWADYDCSSSVNVSITTSKDEFINAGQLSASSSSRNRIFKLISTSIILLVNISLFIGFLLL
ncbi:aspartic proteinase 36 isoform X1 [Actinidia eriantha]|uniref:aspartic proteinase 36 isoform X1 n=1 Tax=Actinidia eriantha TaxID=165200 RepID=UPI00258A7D23|nr:aspartic proteinase 36 isoform X1 [Actinidia eriantha]